MARHNQPLYLGHLLKAIILLHHFWSVWFVYNGLFVIIFVCAIVYVSAKWVYSWIDLNLWFKQIISWAVVVAQLVERSLLIPEVRGSNPVIGKKLLNICLLSTVYWKDENKEKEAGIGPFLKKKKLNLLKN